MTFARTWESARIAGRAWRRSGLSHSFYIEPDHCIPPHLRFAHKWPQPLNSIAPTFPFPPDLRDDIAQGRNKSSAGDEKFPKVEILEGQMNYTTNGIETSDPWS